MPRLWMLLLPLFFLAACAAPAPLHPRSIPTSSPAPIPTLPIRSPAPNPITSIHLVSLSQAAFGYRQATLAVTVQGPLKVNPTICGGPAPVTLWAVNSTGMRLPSDIAYPLICESLTIEDIPAGASKTFSATTSWPASAGPVTLEGHLALAKGFLNLPPFAIPAA